MNVHARKLTQLRLYFSACHSACLEANGLIYEFLHTVVTILGCLHNGTELCWFFSGFVIENYVI